MRFIKNNIWTLCLMALFGTFAFIGDASADSLSGSTVMSIAQNKAVNVFKSVKTIIFIVGGFGLVGIAFAAIFGKVNWKWFAALGVGLAILAAAGSIVNYATGDSSAPTFGDTFDNSQNY
jgi:hypothetical protein